MITFISAIKELKFIVIPLIIAILAFFTIKHHVNEARLEGQNAQIEISKEQTNTLVKEVIDENAQILVDVHNNSNNDNLSMLDESIIILSDPNRSETNMRPELDSSKDDSIRQTGPESNEQSVHRLDDDPRVDAEELREKVCFEINFDPEYGYIIESLCMEGVQ